MRDDHPTPTSEACTRFWQRVATEEPTLRHQDGAQLVEMLNEWIEGFAPDIAIEVAGEQAARRELVLTAHGDTAHFGMVQQLAASAPALLHFDVVPFRVRERDEFSMSMDGFELSGGEVFARCSPEAGQVALEIAFAREIPMDMKDHAKHMAYIMLDHMLGEYDFAIKVGAVDFIEGPMPDDAASLGALADRVDRCWTQDLGHDGRFIPSQDQVWQGLRVERQSTGEEMLVSVNRSANSALGRADLAWHLHVPLPAADGAALDAAQEFEEALSAQLEHGERGLCTHVELRAGVRHMHWQVGDPADTSAAASRLLREAKLDAQPATNYSPAWEDYLEWVE
jgi:hypothetical protein